MIENVVMSRTNTSTPDLAHDPEFANGAAGRNWRIAFLVAATVGVCLALDLLRLHVNVHNDPTYQSYCAINEFVNCETEALSEYSTFAGMPTAAWGLYGYLLMAALAIWGLGGRARGASWPFGLNLALSLFASLVGAWFAFVSFAYIKSLCIVCAASWVTSFLLAFLAYRALRRVGHTPLSAWRDELASIRAAPTPFVGFAAAAAAVLLVAWVSIPSYWAAQRPPLASKAAVGDTDEGHPWIGAKNPLVEIIEFSDYQCPHCQRGHDELRRLLEEHPETVRLVHHHYPLDNACNPTLDRPFHPNACAYARMAYCAQQQGKFWDANDYLYMNGRRRVPITVEELAEATGLRRDALASCVRSASAERAIARDLELGRGLGIRGTPTFKLGNDLYPGRIPPDVVERALQRAAAP